VCLSATLASGACAPADWPTLSGENDNRFSGPWDGVYEGTGSFSNPALQIRDRRVNVTVQITDLGNNEIRVQLFFRPPTNDYSPVLRLEGALSSAAYADLLNLHDVSYHHASLARSATGAVSGLMGVDGIDEQSYWFCTVRVNPVADRSSPSEAP
jgi:hypothetical protein